MRTFERSHPWLSFRLDLTHAPVQLWLLLGEAQSKALHVIGTPLLPAVLQQFHTLALAKGAHATTAIEGNTLTEEQVGAHLRGELKLPRSQQYLQRELDNVVGACNEIGAAILRGERARLSVTDICDFNARVLGGLSVAKEVVAGKVREHAVTVARYPGAPAKDCPFLLERMCAWLNGEFTALPGYEVAFGILKAIVAHVYIAWIHPFGDGNGRTARLVEFQVLISAGVPTTAAHLLSDHYNRTHDEYYRQLDQAHKSKGDLLPFIEYALRGFIDGLVEQIQLLRLQQLDVHWRDFVHHKFHDRRSTSDKRKRDLMLALSQRAGFVPGSEVRKLSPEIAAIYATVSEKTLRRDLDELRKMAVRR